MGTRLYTLLKVVEVLLLLVLGALFITIVGGVVSGGQARIYAETKTWQTGIGAFLGFLALVTGVLFNFWLMRARDDRILQDEKRALLAAIYGEIVVLRERLASASKIVAHYHMIRDDERIDTEFLRNYTPTEPQVYPSVLNRVGILNPNDLWSIVSFFSSYQEARGGLYMISTESETRYAATAFLKPARDAVVRVESFLERIEKLIGFEQSTRPDLGDTEDVIWEYEELDRLYKEEAEERARRFKEEIRRSREDLTNGGRSSTD